MIFLLMNLIKFRMLKKMKFDLIVSKECSNSFDHFSEKQMLVNLLKLFISA